ncbi:hypothetical protein U1Q18_050693 [Sarracenia purpurea var. burkii]
MLEEANSLQGKDPPVAVPFPVPIQHSFKVFSPCHASTSCFADCSCSYCCFLCFLLLTTCLSLTVTAFPLDIPFSLSRAIKGNETGKPKRSPAGECLPIPKPFRSSLNLSVESLRFTLLEETKFAVT